MFFLKIMSCPSPFIFYGVFANLHSSIPTLRAQVDWIDAQCAGV